MKILIVDDQIKDLYKTRQATLEIFPDADIFAITDEKEALEIAQSQQPELAIIDVVLTNMHGYALCREIKEIAENTIVIMLTGSFGVIDNKLAEMNGATDFTVKTWDMKEYKSILKTTPQVAPLH